MPKIEDDWSDSDDDDLGSDIETAVQLGVPDGPIPPSSDDLLAANVSRIGGHPAFLSTPEPPIDSARCKLCNNIMEMLIQVWCPMEDSPNDRALFVWGCARASCQRKEGSVRVWRGLRYNKQYAEKLKKRQARREEKEKEKALLKQKQQEAQANIIPKANPFSMKAAAQPGPFGLGAQIFGDAPAVPQAPPSDPVPSNVADEDHADDASEDDEDEEEDEEDEEDIIVARLAGTTLDPSPWSAAPAYIPLYLSTTSEYLPPAPKVKVPPGAEPDDEHDGGGRKAQAKKDKEEREGKAGGEPWALEGYENSIEVDHAFERFSKRVGYEGEQCLRYELGGTPLPFASDRTFDLLFPTPPAPVSVTKPGFVVASAQRRTYNPSAVPRCPHCGGKRVFECQLMPNLINVLRRGDEEKSMDDEERKKEIMRVLKGEGGGEGMEWGTCLVFACERDCSGEGEGATWREELALVQWDV